ncbi:hypothetical protein N7533_004198 [Penicillium manginii]|uniref:uncharacterized protein n=1 Tax=Penicillium manginii TaxID=203109 RepID=UPI002548E5CC|nr:uncharacterized protein N7533_004198 [Penicillium manginii]KAJ5754655.1 hypothetical protein N7533_004198 [Penicillium manginii]
MSQSASDASWPAAIPEIHLHPTDLSRDELPKEAKGWLLFVKEQFQPVSTPDNGLRQRRALIEKWATASQEFRESYHSRAPACTSALDYPASLLSQQAPRPNKRFLCLPPVDSQTHPRNYIHLVKLLIMLYIHQDEWNGLHPFDGAGAGNAPRCHIPEFLNLATPIALSDILSELYLASADFHALSMTRSGTVVFADGPDYTWYLIEGPGLATGRMTVAEFGSNGSVRDSLVRRAWNMGPIMSFGQDLGRRVVDLAESAIGGPPQYNEPLDMDLPIIELLESTRKSSRFLYEGYGYMDLWVRIIEQNAPGYLDLEAQGRVLEFKLDNLRNVR